MSGIIKYNGIFRLASVFSVLYKVSYKLGKSLLYTHQRMSVKMEITFYYENSFAIEDLLRGYQKFPAVPVPHLENYYSTCETCLLQRWDRNTLGAHRRQKVELLELGSEFLKIDLGHRRRKWPSQAYPINHTSRCLCYLSILQSFISSLDGCKLGKTQNYLKFLNQL